MTLEIGYLFIYRLQHSVSFPKESSLPISQLWEFRRSRSRACLAVSSYSMFPAGATGVVFLKPPPLTQL